MKTITLMDYEHEELLEILRIAHRHEDDLVNRNDQFAYEHGYHRRMIRHLLEIINPKAGPAVDSHQTAPIEPALPHRHSAIPVLIAA